MQKIITVSVSTDLSTDQRVQKICGSLKSKGYQVRLIGRELSNSPPLIKKSFKQERMKLLFKSGFLFYAEFNIRLMIKLLVSRSHLYLANDLDTLPANFVASKLRNTPLLFDSHELFSEVPELVDRPFVKKVWKRFEAYFLKRIKYSTTVSPRISKYYKLNYNLDSRLLRNFPVYRTEVSTSKKQTYLIYQGALNVGRGLETLIEAMSFVKDYELLIAGNGDLESELTELSKSLNLESKVKFLGRLEPEQLRSYTEQALLGFSIEEDLGLNYRYALPNKVFDYIHSSTPVLYADLPVVIDLIGEGEVGEKLITRTPKALAEQIQNMLNSPDYDQWVANCKNLSQKFNWQNEERVLHKVVNQAMEHA